MRRANLVIGLLLLIASGASRATMITYEMTLTIDAIVDRESAFQQLIKVGNTYQTVFSVATTPVASTPDGRFTVALVSDFLSRIGDTIFDQNAPVSCLPSGCVPREGNRFQGLRGPGGFCADFDTGAPTCAPTQAALYAPYTGFESAPLLGFSGSLANGIDGIWGDVYGAGDETFLDLFGGRFAARAFAGVDAASRLPADGGLFTGTIAFTQVPEPGVPGLLTLGVAATGLFSAWVMRTRRRNGRVRT